MTVYVDNVRHQFGRIGVQRKWLQQPPQASWVHFDIALSKKAEAVAAGAVLTDKYESLAHVARLRIASGDPAQVEYGHRQLAMVAQCRARYGEAVPNV